MRFLIQEVNGATIEITHNNKTAKKEIGAGTIVYVGISHEDIEDAPTKIEKFIKKIQTVKLFCGPEGKIDASLTDNSGELLIVSSFTLYSRNKKGSSVDYTHSAPFKQSEAIYDQIINALQNTTIPFQSGTFGAYMKITSTNTGPINHLWER